MAAAVALAVAAAACESDDSGNVMAASGNPLTPAQVDAALGPEIADDPGSNGAAGNEAGNAVDSVNEAGSDTLQESAPANSDSSSAEQ